MIKFIGAALWLVAAALGATFYSFQSAGPEPVKVEDPAALLGGLDYVKTEVVSVPVLRNRAIEGYFLGRFVYTAEPKMLAKLTVPADALIVDEVYSYLFGNPQVDFTKVETVDMDAFRSGIRDAINKRVGEKIIHDVLIEQVDFLTKAEIRDNSVRRRTKPAEADTGSSGGHGGGGEEAAKAASH